MICFYFYTIETKINPRCPPSQIASRFPPCLQGRPAPLVQTYHVTPANHAIRLVTRHSLPRREIRASASFPTSTTLQQPANWHSSASPLPRANQLPKMLRTPASTLLRRSAALRCPASLARANSNQAISKPTLANIEKRWEGMPLQEQADLWMSLRDRMKGNWKELTVQEQKAGAYTLPVPRVKKMPPDTRACPNHVRTPRLHKTVSLGSIALARCPGVSNQTWTNSLWRGPGQPSGYGGSALIHMADIPQRTGSPSALTAPAPRTPRAPMPASSGA